ncbi:uncharacterized protein C6orf163 homolog [Ornithorhynchus anatinus]|uniref:Uncharacterized protein n=1 Tax=Ornithorhynchus anatinus TaxID=9258 RepID=F7G9D0_ORNAN|nr:uncharacterized protein C6orf163 homolog [Ornithorhynchus anatinus]XP_039770800.1 uncharacterized protein C6orf163 homolog [Ornithorhynchus anatinus]
MIRNPNLTDFVCCAVCDKIVPSPPSADSFRLIHEYKPFKTRFYTHRDILEIGLNLQHKEEENNQLQIKKCVEKAQAAVWAQAKIVKESAVEQAINNANTKHLHELEILEKEHENAIKEAVKQAKEETLHYMEDQMKRESEAAEQRMVHRIQRILMECAVEKLQAVEEARREERELAFEALCLQKRKNKLQLKEAGLIASQKHEKNLEQLSKEKHHEISIAFGITQRKKQEETQEMMKEVETTHKARLNDMTTKLTDTQNELQGLVEQLGKMTSLKDFLEAELLETREAFQKYINFTYPALAPGQADFILPKRKKKGLLKADQRSHLEKTKI